MPRVRNFTLHAAVALVVAWVAEPVGAQQRQPPPAPPTLEIVLVEVPGGMFPMGAPRDAASERTHWVRASSLRVMRTEVTNFQFSAFIESTGHITDAERGGAGFVFERGLWNIAPGANWRQPRGPGSTIQGLMNHPVTQVSQRDAAAFCAWAGLRLPREEEWEYAARGVDGRIFPWGDRLPLIPNEPVRANLGQAKCCAGSAADNYLFTSPVGLYAAGASPFGLLDMAGNVWEWTASPYSGLLGKVVMRGGGWASDPAGIRATIRHGNDSDIGMDMVGFRCVADPPDVQRTTRGSPVPLN